MTRDQVIEYIQQAHFGYLATVGTDNAPRVRPVGINYVRGDDVYFFTFVTTRKVAEIAANPRVEVVWANPADNSQVRIRGRAVVVEDEVVQQRYKEANPIVSKILPPQAQHLFCLYKIQPEVVEVAQGLVPYTVVDW